MKEKGKASQPAPRITLESFKEANVSAGGVCKLDQALRSLTDADRKVVLTAFGDSSIQATAISRVLLTMGVDASEFSIRRHRRVKCSTCGDLRLRRNQ